MAWKAIGWVFECPLNQISDVVFQEVQLMTPLDARTYLEAYYDLKQPDHEDLESHIENLAPWALIKTEALEDTWPNGEWEVS